jgi:mannitol-specific phosphotransferase system IIBC component
MDPTPNVITLQMIETAVTAICALIVAFRPGSLTDDQRNAILGAIAAAYVIVIAATEMVRRSFIRTSARSLRRERSSRRHGGSGAGRA